MADTIAIMNFDSSKHPIVDARFNLLSRQPQL